MKIAIPYDNGQIFQHFGQTEQFKLYTAEEKDIENAVIVGTNGSGHGALCGFLKGCGVTTLVCGGIGAGARTALAEVGIDVYPGVSGGADDAAKALLDSTLTFNANVQCDHHGHEHHHGGDDGHHGCRHGNCHE